MVKNVNSVTLGLTEHSCQVASLFQSLPVPLIFTVFHTLSRLDVFSVTKVFGMAADSGSVSGEVTEISGGSPWGSSCLPANIGEGCSDLWRPGPGWRAHFRLEVLIRHFGVTFEKNKEK